jgi:TPR repeat protein
MEEGWLMEVSGVLKDGWVVGSPEGGCCRGCVTAEARAACLQGERLLARGEFSACLDSFRVAAALGHAGAMCGVGNVLGICYRDWGAGVEWMRKAAELGHEDAMCELGRAWREGRGVRKDELGACFWFEKLASQGHPGGMWELARFFEGRDPAKAQVWYRKGAEYGDSASMYSLGELLRRGGGCARPGLSIGC